MKQTRLKPEARKTDLLAAALTLAEQLGYQHITRKQIAEAAGVSGPIIHHYFGTMGGLREELMRYAVEQENLTVIAQGLTGSNPAALAAPEALRRQALESVLR